MDKKKSRRHTGRPQKKMESLKKSPAQDCAPECGAEKIEGARREEAISFFLENTSPALKAQGIEKPKSLIRPYNAKKKLYCVENKKKSFRKKSIDLQIIEKTRSRKCISVKKKNNAFNL